MKIEHGIEIIRRDRDSRGRGVAVAFNSNLMNLKKLDLNAIKGKKKFEILAVRGKVKGYKK